MTRADIINTLRQGVPVTARLVKRILDLLEADQGLESDLLGWQSRAVEHADNSAQATSVILDLRGELAESERHRQILTQQNHELVAKNRELDQACRAMLAGDVAAYRMMRKALGES